MTGIVVSTVLAVVALVAVARSWPPDDPGDDA